MMEQGTDFAQQFRLLRARLRKEVANDQLSLETFDQAVIIFLNRYIELYDDSKPLKNFRDAYAGKCGMEPLLKAQDVKNEAAEKLADDLMQLNGANRSVIEPLRDTVVEAFKVRAFNAGARNF